MYAVFCPLISPSEDFWNVPPINLLVQAQIYGDRVGRWKSGLNSLVPFEGAYLVFMVFRRHLLGVIAPLMLLYVVDYGAIVVFNGCFGRGSVIM